MRPTNFNNVENEYQNKRKNEKMSNQRQTNQRKYDALPDEKKSKNVKREPKGEFQFYRCLISAQLFSKQLLKQL